MKHLDFDLRLVRDQGVGGSNPLSPTNHTRFGQNFLYVVVPSEKSTSGLSAGNKEGGQQFMFLGRKRICDRDALPRESFLQVL